MVMLARLNTCFRMGGRSGGAGWDKPDQDDEWDVSKKIVKEEEEVESWDAPPKKNIDERGSHRTRADSQGQDSGRSKNDDSRRAASRGSHASVTRGSLDDEWDMKHSKPSAAQPAKISGKVQVFFLRRNACLIGHE